LRDGVERLQLRMSIGCEIGDTIARANSEPLQNRRPTIAPIEKLGVAPARLTIDHGDLFRIKFPRAASEFERRQRCFHVWSNYESGALVCGRAPIFSTDNAGRLHSHAPRSSLSLSQRRRAGNAEAAPLQ